MATREMVLFTEVDRAAIGCDIFVTIYDLTKLSLNLKRQFAFISPKCVQMIVSKCMNTWMYCGLRLLNISDLSLVLHHT